METSKRNQSGWGYFTALLFIASGIIVLCKNLNIIDTYVYNIIMSWQMLLTLIGIFSIIKGHFVSGLVTSAIGIYFLMPVIGMINGDFNIYFWPVLLMGFGILIIVKIFYHPKHKCKFRRNEKTEFISTDGFINVDNSLGGIRQTILDETFKGGKIRNRFGSVILDLRRTTLGEGDTLLEIDCNFGGIEIYTPSSWNIRSEIIPFAGGYDDKRIHSSNIHNDRSLILRGILSFSGIEIKN